MVRSKPSTSGYIVQSDLPYLISLNDDPLSSEIMIYNIKLGETILGSNESVCEIGNSNFLLNIWLLFNLPKFTKTKFK